MELPRISWSFCKIIFVHEDQFPVCVHVYFHFLLEYVLQMLRENQNQGNSQLTQLQELCAVVSKSTAPKGIETLEKEVEDLESSLKEHLSRVG
jgi:hypothetical protein